MEEKIITLDNLRINYKIAGFNPAILNHKKIPVLILHGWGGSSDSWIKVQEKLFESGYPVICPDLPGFGKSITPFEIWGVQDYNKFVLNFSRKLGLKRFFLVAHSFGGRIAIKLSISNPEMVEKMILCDAAGIKPKLGIETKIIFQIARIGNAIFSLRYLVKIKYHLRNIFYLFLRRRDYVKANETMKEIIKKVLLEDLSLELQKIKIKTLVIWGEKDKIVPLKYGHIFHKEIKDSKILIFPKIGHSPHLECPEKLSKVIINFFV